VGCQCQCGEGHGRGDSIIMAGPVSFLFECRDVWAQASGNVRAERKSGGVESYELVDVVRKPPGWVTRDSFGCQAPQSVDRPYRQHANHAPADAGLRGVLRTELAWRGVHPAWPNGRSGAPHRGYFWMLDEGQNNE